MENFKITERQKDIVVSLLHEHVHSLSDALVLHLKTVMILLFIKL